MEDTATSFGIDFAQKFPALSAKLASSTAEKTGLDATDPSNIAAAMHSNVFQTEAGKAAQATDPAVIDRVFASPKFAPDTASTETQTQTAFNAREEALGAGVAAKRGLFAQSQEAASQLAELSEFNKEDYRAARLKKLDPVKDLDDRTLALRMQAFTASAMLETDPEIMALPPALQQRAIASKMQVFSDTIQTLAKVRAARLDSANAQIDKEIGAKESQINVSKYRVDSIDSQIKQLESIGGDIDTIASLRLDRIKEMDRLAKARSKSGGMTTQKEFIYDTLAKDAMANLGVTTLTDDQQQELKRQTEMIVKNDPNLAEKMTNAGSYDNYPGIKSMIQRNVPGYQSPMDTAYARGYGLSLSVEEKAKREKAEADIARTRQLTTSGAE